MNEILETKQMNCFKEQVISCVKTEIKQYFDRFNKFRQEPWGTEIIQSIES